MTHHRLVTRLRYLGLAFIAASLTLFAASPLPAQQAPEPVIEVGVVQRFGEAVDAEMTLNALNGDRLTVQFETGGQTETITANQIKIVVGQQALDAPRIQERVVLSTHRSFESAEDSANQWKQRGIETELAQPNSWQVWAKRDVYSTPLLRRLLLKNLTKQGYGDVVFLDTKVEPAIPRTAFIANGYRYNRDVFNITSGYQRIQVQTKDETKLYAGSLRVQPNAYGTYTLVNFVPIESYLRGVVPHEIGLGAPMATKEAQAILARTYALRNLRRFEIDGYELCADTQCQVYSGLGGTAESTDRAIANTRGLVLTYDNELVDALYSSTTGGVTARFTDVWNGADRPYLQAVVDSVQGVWDLSQRSLASEENFRAFIQQEQGFNEEEWDMFRWRYEGTLEEIAGGLRQYLGRQQHPLANFSQIIQMQVAERAASGRVQKIDIQTDMGTVTLEKDEIIRALYPPRSLLFYMEPIYEPAPQPAPANTPTATPSGAAVDPANVISPIPTPSPVLKGYAFIGGGLGHGVGMSQTGAYRLGDLGWTYERILQFYYPNTTLQPISDAIVFWREPSLTEANAASSDAADSAVSTTKEKLESNSASSSPAAEKEQRGITFTLPKTEKSK